MVETVLEVSVKMSSRAEKSEGNKKGRDELYNLFVKSLRLLLVKQKKEEEEEDEEEEEEEEEEGDEEQVVVAEELQSQCSITAAVTRPDLPNPRPNPDPDPYH